LENGTRTLWASENRLCLSPDHGRRTGLLSTSSRAIPPPSSGARINFAASEVTTLSTDISNQLSIIILKIKLAEIKISYF
jgi:hypothetical protein